MAAIALWFHLRLPSCGHGFESQAHHLCFFSICIVIVKRKEKNKQKEAGIGPFFFKKKLSTYLPNAYSSRGQSYIGSTIVNYDSNRQWMVNRWVVGTRCKLTKCLELGSKFLVVIWGRTSFTYNKASTGCQAATRVDSSPRGPCFITVPLGKRGLTQLSMM